MSNRNFDASVIAKRLRDQNVAQQLYGSFINSKAPGNPQTVSTQVGIITTEYYPGVQTTVEQSLQSNYTFSPGGIANYVPDPNNGPTGPIATVPGAPTIDSITPGNTIADVYFTVGTDGGSPITDYKYALDSGSGFGSFISGGLSNPLGITGLINGVTYQIKILAVNAIGDSAESNIQSVTPVAPGPPSGNVFTSPSTNVNVGLSGLSPFGGSNYSYDFGSGNYLTLIGDDSWAFATADFTIEWFQYQTDNRPFPRIFAIGIYPSTSIGCSIEGGTFYAWFPGADSFGSAVPYKNQWVHFAIVRRSGNLYVYKNGIQLSSSVPNTNDITDNTTTLYIGVENGGTDPDTQFEGYLTNMRIVKGLAVYTGNFTVPTSSLTLTASANPYGGSNTLAIPAGYTKLLLVPTVSPPSAPQNLTVTPGVGSVNLYFTPPADDGGDAISNYKYSTDNGASWSFAGTTSSPITVTGLQQNGTLYDVKLLAVNAAGDGAATSAISVAALSTFSPSDIANQNVWLDAQNPSSVILSSSQVTAWNDSSIASNNFAKGPSGTITYDFPSGINSRPALNFTTSAPSLSTYLGKDNFNIAPTNQLTVFLVVRQTGNGVGNSELFFTRNNYQYMDIFNNTNSTGILSANIGNATQRSTGVNIITPTTNTIISFVADSTVDMFVNGSSTLVSSTVRGGLSLNDSTLDWAISGGAFLGNVGELIAYSTPLTTLQRQAVEGYLAWKWGTQDSLPIGHPYKSAPPSITVPNPPTGLGATPGNGQATISFTPGSDGGSAITNYKYSTDGTNYIAISPADASSPITITGLTNGTTYSITLKAVNAIGDSISSASVSVTPVDPFTIETFTTIGTTSWTAPLGITTVEYLIVGGGGGGGGGYDTGGGGGGGGGMVLTGSLAVTAGASYNIEVGAGGSASTNNYPTVGETAGGTGGNSIFATITALGGDGGSGSRTQTGGSGKGGDAQNSNVSSAVGGSGGGNAGTSAGGSGGGGGGATGNGANGVAGSGGLGGTGLTSSISGSSITYGIGGSGARGSIATTGSAGTANRGNGGGGGGFSSGGARNGGAGGSGIVILKY
jgi:hypothetical protein